MVIFQNNYCIKSIFAKILEVFIILLQLSCQVYSEHLDNVGHQFGPFSKEIKQAMKKIDEVLVDFMTIMADTRLDERVEFRMLL